MSGMIPHNHVRVLPVSAAPLVIENDEGGLVGHEVRARCLIIAEMRYQTRCKRQAALCARKQASLHARARS